MIITIARINRGDFVEGVSKKSGKPFTYQKLGIAPMEETLMDINGDSFPRDSRWLSGFSVKGVTEGWAEGDKVKINIVRIKGKKRDGTDAEFLNFKLPEGVEPMVEKYKSPEQDINIDANDF